MKIKNVKGPFLEKQFKVEVEKLQEIPFMFFDRYEIHIQAFLYFVNGKLIISNPHLRKSIFKICTQKSQKISQKKDYSK